MDPLTDKEYWNFIWGKFRSGDRKAFQTIYNEFVDVLFSYGSRITPDRELIRDAIQDMFIDIYRYSPPLRNPGSLEYYLLKTLKNNIYRKLKDNNRISYHGEFIETFDLCFSIEDHESKLQDEHLKLLQEEIKGLDIRKRELLFLKFNSGLTYKEIGDLLKINPETAKKQVYRIIRLLRGKMEEKL